MQAHDSRSLLPGGELSRGAKRFPARARFRSQLLSPVNREEIAVADPLLRAVQRLRTKDDTVFSNPELDEVQNPVVANALRRMDDRLHWLRNLLDQSAEQVTSFTASAEAGEEQDKEEKHAPPAAAPSNPAGREASAADPAKETQLMQLEQLLLDYFSEWRLMSEEGESDPAEQLREFSHSSYMEQILQHFDLPFVLLSQDLRILRLSTLAYAHPALVGLQEGSSLATRLSVDANDKARCLLSSEESPQPWSAHCRPVGNGRLLMLLE